MDDKKLTKKVLAEVASDLSKAMDFEKPIETGDKVTKAQIIDDLKEAGKELLPKDKISDLSQEVLIFLKVELPKPKEPVSDKTGKITGKTEAKRATKAAEKDKKVEPKLPEKMVEKTKKYTRSNALIDAFGKDVKTKTDLIKAANIIYIDNGGADNLNVAKALFGYVMPSLLILGVVIEVENGKYQLASK